VEVRALSEDPAAPSAGALIASAEPAGDGRWYMSHSDGRHVIVATTVEVLERMVGVCDTSLAERWRCLAAQLPGESERATTLRMCAQELVALAGADGSGCCRGGAVTAVVTGAEIGSV
jgi:hypothetical protein